jgi:hypothetical protein
LKDKDAPFGIDLLLPKIGGSARKTNKDYTKGALPELIDIIIESKASLFVSGKIKIKFKLLEFHQNGL